VSATPAAARQLRRDSRQIGRAESEFEHVGTRATRAKGNAMFRRNYCPAPREPEPHEDDTALDPETVLDMDSSLEPDEELEPEETLELDAPLDTDEEFDEFEEEEEEARPVSDPPIARTGSEIRAQFVNPLRPAETSSAAPDRSPLATRTETKPEPAPMPSPFDSTVFPEAASLSSTSAAEEPPATPRATESFPAPVPAPAEPAATVDRRPGHLVIGEGVKIVGQIRECRQIEIFGAVDGDLEVEELIVRENGILKGNVKADHAEVWGALDGEVSVKELLDVKSGGSVSGKTEYGALSIANGGRVVGTLDDGSTKIGKPASVSTFTPSGSTDRFSSEA
jgi:cytoskeletal protein CcmA (bactofilin family)